jgi:quercetin dioxygenase-like cupin family protein
MRMSQNVKQIRDFLRSRLTRRDFIEGAAAGSLSLPAAISILSSTALASDPQQESGHGDHDKVRAPDKCEQQRDQTNLNPFDAWLESEGIPVYRDYHVARLHTLELKPWKRLGVSGAHIDLKGGEGLNEGYLCEIPGKAQTIAQRHLFEEVIFVLCGKGETAIWYPGASPQSIRWEAGSVFSPPLNVWRQHFNRGSVPARFLAITNAPVVIDLFHNAEFVFNNNFVFRDRYDGRAGYFGAGREKYCHKQTSPESSEMAGGVDTWESGFVPDARTLPLYTSRERGAGNTRIELQLSDNTMQSHLSEFEVGTYKKAHRHGPGSYVTVLNGQGYTLMWKGSLKYSEAPTRMRIDWQEGSLFVPPDGWFHQHFNTGPVPARYLAATWGGDGKWFMRALGGGGRTHRLGKTSTRKGGNLVEYEDEDPAIREIYKAELRKTGVKFRMK